MNRKLLLALAVVFAVILTSSVSAFARHTAATIIGYDVSFPQCGTHLPSRRAFAVVGVDGGRAGTANRCFHSQLTWASHLPARVGVPNVSLYVNTDDPGRERPRNWPHNNVDPTVWARIADPYGRCTGRNTRSCAWQFGWNMVDHDIRRRGISQPQSYTWWLDVETTNTWEGDRLINRAVLEGMVDVLKASNINMGVYSTGYQWGVIVGHVPPSSPLRGVDEWLTGASTLAGARQNCGMKPFAPGGKVVLTQWFTNNNAVLDGDVACGQ